MIKLVQFTQFNAIDHRDDQPIDIDVSEVQSVVGCETADHYGYTTIIMNNGVTYSVKESVQDVKDKVNEANQPSAEESNDAKAD